MTDTIEAMCKRVLELSEKATAGPWYSRDDTMTGVAHDLNLFLLFENSDTRDNDLIAEYRTLAPKIAEAYLELLNLIKKGNQCGK